MNVTVKFGQAGDKGGWEVALFVKPSDTVGDLKKAIQQCKSIPVETQVLQFKSKVLENEYALRSFHFNDKTLFQLHCRLNILAIVHSRQQLTIATDPYETIASLKSKIAAVLKKPAERLALFKDANVTNELNQRRAVSFMKCREIFVKVFEGPGYFSISAVTTSGKVIPLIAAGSDTVELTKERLLVSLKIFNKDFSNFINLTYNNVLMEDRKRLSEYGVQNASVLKLVLACSDTFHLRNLSAVDNITLSDVTLFDTVGEIKRKAASLLGVKLESLQLIHSRRNKVLNNEARTLFECGITSPERELRFIHSNNMILVMNELFGTIHVNLWDEGFNWTSKKLKDTISTLTGVMPGDQSLSFRGINFDSYGKETLASIGVKAMSTLQLSVIRRRRRPCVTVEVIVSRHVGKLSLLSSDSVKHLSEEMGKQCGIDLSNYSCLYETMMPIGKAIPFGNEPITVIHFEPPKAEVSTTRHPGTPAAKVVSSASHALSSPATAPPLHVAAVAISRPQFAMTGSAPCSLWKMISGTLHDNPTTSAVAAPMGWEYFSFQVFVKTLTGKSITLKCGPYDSVYQLKERLFEIEGIPPEQQRFVCAGVLLDDVRSVSDYKIAKGTIINLVLQLRGC